MAHIKFGLLGLLLFISSGCALMRAKEQVEVIEKAALIKGTVNISSSQKGPVVVVCLSESNRVFIQKTRTHVSAKGHYKFSVLLGNYIIAAFIDVNRDGHFQVGEHGHYHSEPLILHVQAGEQVTVPPLLISGDPSPRPVDIETAVDFVPIIKNMGKVKRLSDPLFSKDNCAMGMWQPLDFLQKVGGGLFMLQDYQPDKMPVVFIHGMGGGPLDWEAVIETMDKEHFQPWVLYYPSGLRLDMVSDYLVTTMTEMKARYDFTDWGIAAHSMGGLVARSFIMKYVKQFPEQAKNIRFVMTVNSLMGGIESATTGVNFSPVVIPAWRDVAIESKFLKELHAWSWPQQIPYHLFFSYRTGESGDGVVSLQSQLPQKLQSEAMRIYGFNNDHVGTLRDEDFLKIFHRIIGQTRKCQLRPENTRKQPV